MQEWDEFWISFLNVKKLNTKVDNLNELDGCKKTETICKAIYENYDKYKDELDNIRILFVKEVEHLPGVHLQTSRVKSLDSILEKIVNKRYDYSLNSESLYSSLNSDNYRQIITDLIGVRIIISYRGEWKTLHNEIVCRFHYMNENDYIRDRFIPHIDGDKFIAEIPKAYYADGDDLSIYDGILIDTRLKETGYRSVHYVISYMNTYIELQTRTIYDEAWSDCDHSYVYKHEENRSHAALEKLSRILCSYTNTSNDLGDIMHKIYETESIVDEENDKFVSDIGIISEMDGIIGRYEEALRLFREFRDSVSGR